LTFESLNIHPSIKKGLEDVQISEAKKIHKDLLDLFRVQVPALIKTSNSSLDELLLPLLHYITESDEKQFKSNRIGILCPTASFAIEVEQWIWAVGYHAKIRCSRVTQREEKAIQEQALKITAIYCDWGSWETARFYFRWDLAARSARYVSHFWRR
jgi:hypothetical protein